MAYHEHYTGHGPMPWRLRLFMFFQAPATLWTNFWSWVFTIEVMMAFEPSDHSFDDSGEG